jgi:hypothetical protein
MAAASHRIAETSVTQIGVGRLIIIKFKAGGDRKRSREREREGLLFALCSRRQPEEICRSVCLTG